MHKARGFVRISLILWIALLAGVVSCGQGAPSGGGEPAGASAQALGVSGTDILGFETPLGWVVAGGVPSSTTTRTQGNAALAVTAPIVGTTLTSLPLASGLAPLAALTDAASSVSVDVQIPASEPNPHNFGSLQLFVTSATHLVVLQSLGTVSLNGQRPGTFQTYSFAVTDFVRKQLAGATYSDLVFTFNLQAPLASFGTYVFDNLRTKSPASQPLGGQPSVDLTAMLATSPASNTPGFATFTTGSIQIPASFHVAVGDSGTGSALFELGTGSTTSVACTYKASSDTTSYVFSSCTTGNKAGDFVLASFARLTIQSADPAAPLTKVKAQLALNAVGDQVGAGLLPPIPTFWGQTVADFNTISQAFSQQQLANLPSVEQVVNLPIPDIAKIQGDGTPLNVLPGATLRTPTDPPFDFKGDLNNSHDGSPTGMFDGYYELSGTVSTNETTNASGNNSFSSHFDGAAKVGAQVVGAAIDVLKVSATIDTNNGGTSATGSTDPTSTGTFQAFLFGNQFENDTTTVQTGFDFKPMPLSLTFDAPPIPIWVFSITAGVSANASIEFKGALAINGFQLTAMPKASISADIEGDIGVPGIISGGVSATIQLISVSVPATATLTLDVNTDPAVCAVSVDANVNGSVVVTAGSGELDLDATFGPCPACYKTSMPIFSWPPAATLTKTFPAPFPITLSGTVFTLSSSLCRLPLTATITKPTAGQTYLAGIPEPTAGSASRPPIDGQLFGATVPCQDLTWTTTDPGAMFSPSNTGCNPDIIFSSGAVGTTQTISVSATDQFGETTTNPATVTVNVAAAPSGPVPTITSPTENELFPSAVITFTGYITNGSGTVTVTWTLNNGTTTTTLATQMVTAGAAGVKVPVSFTINPIADGNYTLTLTASDASNSNPVAVDFNVHIPT
jgi:hypothetical protein